VELKLPFKTSVTMKVLDIMLKNEVTRTRVVCFNLKKIIVSSNYFYVSFQVCY